jgi:hypothetical protein
MYSCCAVFITHKELLSGYELDSFRQWIKILKDRKIFFVIPESIDEEFYLNLGENIVIKKVDDSWLESYSTYNRTLTKPEFYRMFEDYDYMLIYQTDCWIFEDRLDYFMNMEFDWYGAPWPFWNDKVGNGGFSLRKISEMIDVCEKYKNDICNENEDTWFCIRHENELNICDSHTASEFSLETNPEKYLQNMKGMPMGLHGKYTMKYWSK